MIGWMLCVHCICDLVGWDAPGGDVACKILLAIRQGLGQGGTSVSQALGGLLAHVGLLFSRLAGT
jgi:hypothetical protein